MRTSFKKRLISFSMVITLVISLFSGFTPNVKAAAAGTSQSGLAYNKGNRTTIATELSAQAKAYYSGNNLYSSLSKQSAEDIYDTLQKLMRSTLTNQVTYSSLTGYWTKTDTINGQPGVIGIYCNQDVTSYYNREHVWPKSHGYFLEKNAGADLHHLRPSNNDVNSTRSSYTMGNVRAEASSVKTVKFNNSTVAGWLGANMYEPLDISKGDVARIFLYVYCCWAQPNLFKNVSIDSSKFDDDDTKNDGVKVIESLDVLLEWCYEDPVDTWEMQRNDLAEQVQGNRNVFIDYPEYAWLLFGKEVPSDLVSPTSGNTTLKQYPVGPDNSKLNEEYGGTGVDPVIQLSADRYVVADGDYVIYSESQGVALSAETASSYYRAATPFTKGATTDSNLIWTITRNEDTSYTIKNGSKVLCGEEGHQSLPFDGAANKWYLYGNEDGTFFFRTTATKDGNILYLNADTVLHNEFAANPYTGNASFALTLLNPSTGVAAVGEVDKNAIDPVGPVVVVPELPETPENIVDGRYVIVNAASLKALSADPSSNAFYLAGKDVTFTDKKLNGTPADDIIWALTKVSDDVYKIQNGENVLSMDTQYTSTPFNKDNNTWKITRSNKGTVLLNNVGRDGYTLEWFAKNNYFSGYNVLNDLSAFEMILVPLDYVAPTPSTEPTPTPTDEPTPTPTVVPAGELQDGKYVIYNAESGMAMSSKAVSDIYRAGVAYTVADGKIVGEVADTEIWVLTNNADGTITLSNDGKKLSMSNDKNSAPFDAENTTWKLQKQENGTYYVFNATRSDYALEWYSKYNEFSTFNKNVSGPIFEMTFIALDVATPTPTTEPTPTVDPTAIPTPSVTPAVPAKGFTKINSLDELTDGQYIIVSLSKGSYFMMDVIGAGDKNARPAQAVAITDNKISSADDKFICTIKKTTDGQYTIQDANDNFLPMSNNSNKCFGKSNLSDADKYCYYDVKANGTDGAFFFTNENNKNNDILRAITYNVDSKDFRGLAKNNSSLNPLFLFKLSSQSVVNFYVDGVLYDSQAVDNGKGAVAPATPEDYFVRNDAEHKTTYYTFQKWDKDFSNITADLDVNAVFTKNVVEDPKYTVSFFEDETATTAIKTVEVYDLADATAPAAPSKADIVDETAKKVTKFTFIGWSDPVADENDEYKLSIYGQWTSVTEDLPVEFTIGQFQKIESLADLEDGMYLLVSFVKKTNAPYAMNNVGTTTRGGEAVTIRNDGTIVTDNSTIVWTIKKQADGTYTIADLDGKFLPMSNNKNQCYGSQTATANKYCYYVAEANGEEGAIFFFNNAGYGRLISMYDNSGKEFKDFRGYFTTVVDNIRPLYLYKFVTDTPSVETVEVTFIINGKTYPQTIEKGSNATAPEVTPVKADEYDKATHTTTEYTFSGWNKSLENITEDTTIEPVFTSTQVEDTFYYVTFISRGVELDKQKVYAGEDATAPADPENYTVRNDAEHLTTIFKFAGWSQSFEKVSDNLTVEALFRGTDQYDPKYSVKFMSNGVQIGETQYVYAGESAVAPSEVPTKADDYFNHITTKYTFSNWSEDFTNVQKDLVISAVYSFEEVEDDKFTVTFVADGKVVDTQVVYAGENAVAPATPAKADEYSNHITTKYTFKGWNKSFENITADTEVVAEFESEQIEDPKQTVVIVVDGEEIISEEYFEDEIPAEPTTVPTKADEQVGNFITSYTFEKWEKKIDATTGRITYTAVFSSTQTEIIDIPDVPVVDPLPQTGDDKRVFIIVCVIALISLAGFKFAEKKACSDK